MKIYFIRHGQTSWNQKQLFQGWEDIPLDENGRLQAQQLGAFFKPISLKAIYSSDLIRAVETAQAISSIKNIPLIKIAELKEINVGDWCGLTWQEIQAKYPDHLSQTDFHIPIPNGESFQEVLDRSLNWLKTLKYQKTDAIAIVTHGGVIRLLLCILMGLPLQERHRFTLNNASISEIDLT